MQIPIFYGINDQYAPLLGVSIQSLIDHTEPTNDYNITIMYQTLSKENQKRLVSLATDNVTISFTALDEKFDQLFDNDNNLLFQDYRTLTIYYRLFIPVMFPNESKVIYLDADTMLRRDIADMYQIALDENWFGAVVDQLIQVDPDLHHYPSAVIGVNRTQYVNSGVLLMNLAALRQAQFTDHFLKLLQHYHFNLIAADQDYINAMGHHHIKYLAETWNTQTAAPANQNSRNAALVHYNLFGKPWHYLDVPYHHEFWQIAATTPFASELKQKLNSHSDLDTADDQNKHDNIVTLAQNLAHEPVTLKSVLKLEVP